MTDASRDLEWDIHGCGREQRTLEDANFTEESSCVKFSRETGRILCTVSSGQWLGVME